MPTGVYVRTKEHCKNMSLCRQGKRFSTDHKKKIGAALIGRVVTWGYKISKGRMGIVPWNRGIPRTDDCKKKISVGHIGKRVSVSTEFKKGDLKNSGENHHNWKGGVTPINAAIRKSSEYELWREAVFKRDNYTCIWCGDNSGGNLEADHIKPFSLFPELRFAIDNGRTLCHDCHSKTDTYGCKMIHYANN